MTPNEGQQLVVEKPETPQLPDDHWNRIYTDPAYFGEFSKRPSIKTGAALSPFPDAYAKRQANIAYLSSALEIPIEEMPAVYEEKKNAIGKESLGSPTTSDDGLFELLKKRFESENEKKALSRQILENVITRGLKDSLTNTETPFVESVGKDLQANADKFTPEEMSQLWDEAEKIDINIRATTAKFAPEAKFLLDALQKQTGQTPALGGSPDMRKLAAQFAKLPENQRSAVYQLVGSFAQLTKTDKGFWYQMAESLGRGTSDIAERVPRNFTEQTLRGNLRLLESGQPVFQAYGLDGSVTYSAAGTTPLTPEQREAAKTDIKDQLGVLDVERELRNMAETVVDPIKMVTGLPTAVEEGLYGAARSVPYSAVAAVPYVGIPAVGSALFASNYDQIRLDYPDLDPDKAALLAAASAPVEAVLERMKVEAVTGKLPIFGSLLRRFKHPGQKNIVRIMLGAGAIAGEENTQEWIQNMVFPVAQTIGAALDEDIPGYDWRKRIEGMPREMIVQFVALLPLMLIGAGVMTHNEIKRGAAYLKDSENLRKIGLSEEAIARITGAESAEEAQKIYREEFLKRDPKMVVAAAKKMVDDMVSVRQTEQPASIPKMERRGAEYVILAPDGNVMASSPDIAAAEQMLVSAQRDFVRREMEAVHNGINEAVDFITKVNEARQRGEDIAKVIQDYTPRTLFTDYEANPTEENLNNLFATARAFGADPKEPEDLKQFPILASNQGALREGIWRSIIRINEGASGVEVMREFAQDNLKRALAENRISMDWVREKLNELLPQIETDRIERRLRTETDNDVIEAFSDVAVAYFRGQIKENDIPPGLRGFFRRMAIIMRDIFRRAYRIAKMRAEGKLDRDFEALLAEAIGVDQQAIVDRSRETSRQNVPDQKNYSIGILGKNDPYLPLRTAEGKYKGAPKWINAPKTRRGRDEAYARLRERLYQLVKEGEPGRFWYEDSGRAVLRMFNNDVVEAEKFIELLAIYSPQATVEVNTYFALRAYIQRAVNAAKEDFAVKTGTQYDKAKSVLYDNQPWAGRKTDNFYKNIMYVLLKELPSAEVSKLKLDPEVYEMLQKPVTVDMWVYRAFGFDSDALTDIAGTGAFGFAERELNRIASELNANLQEGEQPYLPHQIQAMLWTAIKGRAETKEVKDLTESQSMKAKDMVKVKNAQGKLVREFKDKEAQKRHMQRWINNALALPSEKLDVSMAAGAFDRFINSVSMRSLWETVPSTSTAEGAAIAKLPTAQKEAFTRAARDIILDENGNDMLAAMLGVPVNVSQLLSGGYGTGATPNVVSELFPNKPSGAYDDDVVRAYSRAIQYIFRQDAVPWMRYIKFGAESKKSYYAESPNGAKRRFATQAEAEAYAAGKDGYSVKGDPENFALMLDFGEQLQPDDLDNLQKGLVEIHESLGFTQVSPTEVIVVNYRDSETGIPALTDQEFAAKVSAYGGSASIRNLHTVGEYGPTHDWGTDQAGEGLLSSSARLTPDILEWIRGRRAVSDSLQKEWAEGRGVTNYSISTPSQIARVSAAMGALDRDPLERIKIYEKAQEKFLQVMADNREEIAAMQQAGEPAKTIRRTKLLQALGELDGLLSVLPPSVQASVGGYTVLANAGTGDKGLANFFVKRIDMINKALERFLREEFNTAAVELFRRAKPQRDMPGQKPKGKLGPDVHSLFDLLKQATEWSAEQAQAWADGQLARVEAGELSPQEEAHAILAAQAVPLFADWENADSTQRAAAVAMGKDILNRAYKSEKQRIIAMREKRAYDRMDLEQAAGVSAGDDKARQERLKAENSLPAKWEGYMLNGVNFDQLLSYIFGEDSKVAGEIIDRQRKADNAKSDGIAALSDEWDAFVKGLTGGNRMKADELLFSLSRMDQKIDGVPYSQNQLMAITMMWMQPKGRQHMEGYLDSDGQPVGKWHYNQDFVNKAERLLTPEAKAVRAYLLQKYEAEYEAINKVYRKIYGINLPKNQFYSPLVVESVGKAAAPGIDAVTGSVFAAGSNAPGALRSRGGAIAKPVFRDAVQTYFAHMLQMEHWKAYAEFNSDVSGILNHRDIRDVVRGKAGQEAATVLGNWVDYFAMGGNKDAGNSLAINQLFNRITSNFAQMALFGRIATLALQATQLGAAAAKMPLGAYLSRFGKLMSGRLAWKAALDSDYIQRRIKDMPPAVQLAMQGLRAEKPSMIREATRRLGNLLSGADGLFTAGTYAMVYDYQLSQAKKAGMSGADAEDYARNKAERITDEIAQPTRAGARSIYELNSTNPVARAVWAFSSESRKNLALMAYSAANRPKLDAGKAVLYALGISGLLAVVIRNAWRDLRDDDDDEIFDEKNWGWRRLAAMTLGDPFYGFPVLGESVQGLINGALGVYSPNSGTLFDLTPVVPAAKRMPQHAMDVLEGEADFANIAADVNRILSVAGYFNSTIASYAAWSNLVRDAFQVATTSERQKK